MGQAAFLLGTLLVSAAAFEANAEEFVFGWKPGLSCRVRNSMQKGSGAPVILSYTLKTTAGPGGHLVIDTIDPRLDSAIVAGSKERSYLAQQMTAVNMPAFQVDAEGNLVGLVDLEGTQKKLRDILAITIPDDKARERTLQAIATKELLESVLAVLWSPAVQYWSGASLGADESASNAMEARMPIGGAPFTMNITFKHAGKVPCGASSQRECVKLVVHQSPEPVSLEKAIAQIAEQFGGSMEGATIEKLDVRIYTETVTDPRTLIPSSVIFEKRSDLRIVDKGKPEERSTYERREWTFTCP